MFSTPARPINKQTYSPSAFKSTKLVCGSRLFEIFQWPRWLLSHSEIKERSRKRLHLRSATSSVCTRSRLDLVLVVSVPLRTRFCLYSAGSCHCFRSELHNFLLTNLSSFRSRPPGCPGKKAGSACNATSAIATLAACVLLCTSKTRCWSFDRTTA